MAKLPSLITNETSGEALNYQNYGDIDKAIYFKQVFEVVKNENFTWTIKSSLYLKLKPNFVSTGGMRFPEGIWQRIGNEYFKFEKDIQLLAPTGIWIDGVRVSNNAYEYYKVSEITKTYQCNNTGRYAVRIDCGFINTQYSDPNRYCSYYTLIYDTFPSFSGLSYKINNGWKSSMPWIKVNGEWKRAKQYIKINNEWKECKDSWIWNPET